MGAAALAACLRRGGYPRSNFIKPRISSTHTGPPGSGMYSTAAFAAGVDTVREILSRPGCWCTSPSGPTGRRNAPVPSGRFRSCGIAWLSMPWVSLHSSPCLPGSKNRTCLEGAARPTAHLDRSGAKLTKARAGRRFASWYAVKISVVISTSARCPVAKRWWATTG